jgi:hypothetical protein
VRDAFSRFVLGIKILRSGALPPTKAAFVDLFRRYGVPDAIQCDNGSPFISAFGRGGLTQLSAWWISLGIKVIRSRPACPQDNGAHERMHRDMAADLQAVPSDSARAQQAACDRWRLEFNNVRPHEALGGKVPADVYKRSERTMRKTTPIYPSAWITRRVARNGQIKVKEAWYTAGKALVGELVAIEVLDARTGRLWFRDLDLGEVELMLPDTEIDDAAELFLAKKLRKTG